MNKLQWNSNRNSCIFIQVNAFETAKWQPFCLGLNVLRNGWVRKNLLLCFQDDCQIGQHQPSQEVLHTVLITKLCEHPLVNHGRCGGVRCLGCGARYRRGGAWGGGGGQWSTKGQVQGHVMLMAADYPQKLQFQHDQGAGVSQFWDSLAGLWGKSITLIQINPIQQKVNQIKNVNGGQAFI